MTFALGTFSKPGEARFAGFVQAERVLPLNDLRPLAKAEGLDWRQNLSVLDLLLDWDVNLEGLCRIADRADGQAGWIDLAYLAIHPPVDLPRQLICTGANYRKHVVDLTIDSKVGPPGLEGEELRRWAEEMMDRRAATGEPYAFPKLISAITGAHDPIMLPATTQKPDWELELGVIIGKPARNVSRVDALAHVAGYTIVNDVSARDLIPRTDYAMLGTDWLASKSPPTFMPMGPYLVPAPFVADPQDLRLTLSLNGRVMQDESTADMIFDVARQIEYLSRHVQLLPGDLIATGSPAGNGTHYNRFLQPGDVVEATITGLGMQRNACVAST